MGFLNCRVVDLIQKVAFWMRGSPDLCSTPAKSDGVGPAMCGDCQESVESSTSWYAQQCRSCGRMVCRKCLQACTVWPESDQVERLAPVFCKLCFQAIMGEPQTTAQQPHSGEKLRPLILPESSSSGCNGDRLYSFMENQRFTSRSSPGRSTYDENFDEDEVDECEKQYLTPRSEFSQYSSDVDSLSIGTGDELYSFRSFSSSPLDSPHMTVDQESTFVAKVEKLADQGSPTPLPNSIPHEEEFLENSSECTHDSVSYHGEESQKAKKLVDFQSNERLWYPPPPEGLGDDEEKRFFVFNDDDDEVGDLSVQLKPCTISVDFLLTNEKPNEGQKQALQSAVHGHFRALVSQLLLGEGIISGNENGVDWLETVSSLAWRAAGYVKPDARNGGTMDPANYVKIKCIPSCGRPSDSTLVKGVVCTKNVKHKRMISQHKNPKLLLLGGALEYQKAPNELASMNTLIAKENFHMKFVLDKIEALRPNVLLVEKSVSSYAQEHLLAKKEISLVLNVKRSLMERIALCTGAEIAPTIDNISSVRLGHCKVFRIEKVNEESPPSNCSKKSMKTLMFFDGCSRPLGCTVLLRGACYEELKKIKRVVQYASFAAYHLSLETSFLADEGATLPKFPLGPPMTLSRGLNDGSSCIPVATSFCSSDHKNIVNCNEGYKQCDNITTECTSLSSDIMHKQGHKSSPNKYNHDSFVYSSVYNQDNSNINLTSPQGSNLQSYSVGSKGQTYTSTLPSEITNSQYELQESVVENNKLASDQILDLDDWQKKSGADNRSEVTREYLSAADNPQSILVSLSSTCIPKGTVCGRSQLLRIKFYGSFDKPLGRYLRDDLFNQTFCCGLCKEPTEAHVRCYMHQQGSLSISVNKLSSGKLPGEHDGKIWMWHRCLKCEMEDGVPPAVGRVIMSDAAWGLSFGKFLELSFSNNATANRVARCGHSLQRDCLRFYGFGDMVAFFRYSSIDVLSVYLPPATLNFTSQLPKEWVGQEVSMIYNKIDFLHAEVSNVLHTIQVVILTTHDNSLEVCIQKHIMELKDLLEIERNNYDFWLQKFTYGIVQTTDVLEFNNLRRALLCDSYMWSDRLRLLELLCRRKSSSCKVDLKLSDSSSNNIMREQRGDLIYRARIAPEETNTKSLDFLGAPQHWGFPNNHEHSLCDRGSNINNMLDIDYQHDLMFASWQCDDWNKNEVGAKSRSLHPENTFSISDLSDKIDSAWTGSSHFILDQPKVGPEKPDRKLCSPVRVDSFDSSLRQRNRLHTGFSLSASHFSSFKSDSSGYFASMMMDSHVSPRGAQKFDLLLNHIHAHLSSAFLKISNGVRLLRPSMVLPDVVIAIYDDEPTSIISYALASQEYSDYISSKLDRLEENCKNFANQASYSIVSSSSDCPHYGAGSDESLHPRVFSSDPKGTHFKMSFDDDSSYSSDKAKFYITCYFAEQFDTLRKKCYPDDMGYICSLSRCKRWDAQGGKSNAYFAKSLDERFVIKQLTKTELESFEDFAPRYFKYLTESISSGNPTCLAKVLGIYQVTVKYLKGGRELKMNLMVMENLFYKRSISRIYDLKGSLRSRYIPDTSGDNKVLLDMNLLETLGTRPIFLGCRAKRRLERAVWNDTSFLASIDVMDYSLVVGIDEEQKELVVGIIDFIRQYTWDKHLETWVKTSGILGGAKNASPTVISPMQYKKRFRKAMSSYFLTVPDQWST